MQAFFLSPSETETLQDKVRPQMQIPPACIAFELEGQKQILKAYFPVVRKAATLGQSTVGITLSALRDLEPLGYDTSYNLDLHDDCDGKATPIMVGIDCLNPKANQGSRVEVYIHSKTCTFAAARDIITLGGRLNGEFVLKKVVILQSIWHLLLNEPDSIPDNEIDYWTRKERAPGAVFSGVLFSVDLAAGEKIPDIKTYLPVFQYAKRIKTVFRNTNAVLNAVGHDWGRTGRFHEVAMDVL
ncbi:hypothetical protein M426DRAFT_17453 [Hypoxylon sp. CI-4A]|nr:hypothetical protein M426DRAFT_17453 [Hypoxylon sp. CI-4A]